MLRDLDATDLVAGGSDLEGLWEQVQQAMKGVV
jgi:hypothetical protein